MDSYQSTIFSGKSFENQGKTHSQHSSSSHSDLPRDQLVILILTTFILLIVFVSYWNNRFVSTSIPKQSLVLSKELAKNFSGTAVPEYVLTYGSSARSHTFLNLTWAYSSVGISR